MVDFPKNFVPQTVPSGCPGILRHLCRLTGTFQHRGREIPYIVVYSRPEGDGLDPPLTPMIAEQSGFEGVACVDDVSRAAMLALQYHELTGSPVALQLAQRWMTFVSYMQARDGCFHNFICDASGTKNYQGQTSYKGGSWWTVRAVASLVHAWRVTRRPHYRRRFLRAALPVATDIKIAGSLVLILLARWQAEGYDKHLCDLACSLCDQMLDRCPDYFRTHPEVDEIDLFGYTPLQAMAQAARLFGRGDYLAACERTVEHLIQPVMDDGFYHVYPHMQDSQCVYDISPLVLGLEELYRATEAPRYRTMALRCASWLDGNNCANTAMYDATTGRCLDGLSVGSVNRNTGAESAIEAGFIELARRRLQLI